MEAEENLLAELVTSGETEAGAMFRQPKSIMPTGVDTCAFVCFRT